VKIVAIAASSKSSKYIFTIIKLFSDNINRPFLKKEIQIKIFQISKNKFFFQIHLK
jgi:hypothetical protein